MNKKNRIQSYVFEIKRFIAICTSGGGREKIRGNWVAKLIKLPDVTWCDLYLDITQKITPFLSQDLNWILKAFYNATRITELIFILCVRICIMSWLPRLTTIVTITNLNDILPLLPVQKLDTRQKETWAELKRTFHSTHHFVEKVPRISSPFRLVSTKCAHSRFETKQ